MANTTTNKGTTRKATTNGAKPRQPKADAAPPPAYFLSLKVENFRCFGPKQTLDLSDGNGRPAQWTVILGNNGVGKTSLLQCLAGLQPKWDMWLHQEPNQKIKYRETLVPTISQFPDDLLFDEAFRGSIQSSPLISISSRVFYNARLAALEDGIQFEGFGLKLFAPWDSELISVLPEEHNISGLVCYGYGASRRMTQTSLAERKDNATSASLFSDEVALMNAEEWLLQADYAAIRESNLQKQAAKRRDQIKDILIELLPDVTDIRIAATENDLTPKVEVQTPYGWVHIQSLSLGYKTLIAWMVDLASRLFERYPHSKNPLAEPAVVLVDEIDLHLHPEWQRKLIGDLTKLFPNTQFIVTAHSPLVVQAASDANIVLLRRKEDKDYVVIHNNMKPSEGLRVDQVLTSDLFGLESARPPQLDAAMAERNKILGKGTLTKADKAKLKKLEAEVGQLPTGETPDDLEAMDIIRRAAALLKNGQDGAS